LWIPGWKWSWCGNRWCGDRFRSLIEHAIDFNPQSATALAALGRELNALRRPEEAVAVLEKAVALSPDDPELHCELGDALQTLGLLDRAMDAYASALNANPAMARAWYAAGCAESSRREYVSALICFHKALDIHPEWPEALHNLGQVFFKLGRLAEAVELFRRTATAGDAELPLATLATVIPGSPADTNGTILEARQGWAQRYLPPARPDSRFAVRAKTQVGPMRIGYVSSFFQNRNWMKPVWGLINRHDEAKFEVHLFSDAPASAIAHGYRGLGTFHNISGLSNPAAADEIERCEIDLLVDLNGYSAPQRLPLLALRPTPVMVGWFNSFATTGMSCYDYLIGDEEVIPPEEEHFYCEKIVRVPGSYLTFEVTYPVPEVVAPPCASRSAVTFGCLAPLYKINHEVVAAWSRILEQAGKSSLVLRNAQLASSGVREFVRRLFEEHGISRERIRLEGPAEHYQFLKTYDEIDIALDTFPYNGGTTTTEAIWQGVPVLAFRGDRWVARTSASILRAGGLGEFVAPSLDDYISMAVSLALRPETPARLAQLRAGMRDRLRASPVCDAGTLARNMERLYEQMGHAFYEGAGRAAR
jgi:protein O-GlcNAc transferase